MSCPPIASGVGTGLSWRLLIETMEEMKLTYPNSHVDERSRENSLQAVA
jgi:hypothetical protein